MDGLNYSALWSTVAILHEITCIHLQVRQHMHHGSLVFPAWSTASFSSDKNKIRWYFSILSVSSEPTARAGGRKIRSCVKMLYFEFKTSFSSDGCLGAQVQARFVCHVFALAQRNDCEVVCAAVMSPETSHSLKVGMHHTSASEESSLFSFCYCAYGCQRWLNGSESRSFWQSCQTQPSPHWKYSTLAWMYSALKKQDRCVLH